MENRWNGLRVEVEVQSGGYCKIPRRGHWHGRVLSGAGDESWLGSVCMFRWIPQELLMAWMWALRE